MKIEITAARTKGFGGVIKKIVEVDEIAPMDEIVDITLLKWLNQYINRDSNIRVFTKLSEAKKFSGLKIEGVICES